MHRRELLQATLAAGGASLWLTTKLAAADEPAATMNIVDTNVSLFQWPFRRLPLDEPAALVAKLRSLAIREAWAGSFEGLLHRDVTGVNERLVETCRNYPELVPIGSINPRLPDWETDLQRCLETHDMLGVRVHPNYHEYPLDDPAFNELLRRVAEAGRLLQIVVAMEDPRTQHPLVQVPDVDLAPLPTAMRDLQGARVQLLNHRLKGTPLEQLGRTPGIYFDTARTDGTDGVAKLLRSVPQGRVLLGTHAPFLVPEAALIRVAEAQLAPDELQRLLFTNAQALRRPRA